jgi:PKD repeat protein
MLALPVLLSGCVLDDVLDGVVNREPRAVVDAKPTQGQAPLTVSLDAHYSHDDDGSIVEYRWDLGDPADTGGKLMSAMNHEFRAPGMYVVKLTVTDNEGAMNSQQLAVVVSDPPPLADVTVSNFTPRSGDSIEFDGSASSDPYGKILNYQWDFGDGTTAATAKATHVYKAAAKYTATLTVTDDANQTGQGSVMLDVTGTSSCGGGTCGGSSTRPLAVIEMRGVSSCSGGRVGVPVRFDGTASRPGEDGGSITLYQWDFGDGTNASGPAVEHTYAYASRYLVTLRVTNSAGGSATAQGACPIGGAVCTGQ